MHNTVTVYCPKCHREQDIENETAEIVCSGCGKAFTYDAFTCSPGVELDSFGIDLSDRHFDNKETAARPERRVLNGSYVELAEDGDVLIQACNRTERAIEEASASAICIDNEGGYYANDEGIWKISFSRYSYQDEPELINEYSGIKNMVAYQDYFIFIGDLGNGVYIMPKKGGWIRKVYSRYSGFGTCRRLNVFGNWAYYAVFTNNHYNIYRVSLDGKQRVLMRTHMGNLDEYTVRVNKYGVFFDENREEHYQLGLMDDAATLKGKLRAYQNDNS